MAGGDCRRHRARLRRRQPGIHGRQHQRLGAAGVPAGKKAWQASLSAADRRWRAAVVPGRPPGDRDRRRRLHHGRAAPVSLAARAAGSERGMCDARPGRDAARSRAGLPPPSATRRAGAHRTLYADGRRRQGAHAGGTGREPAGRRHASGIPSPAAALRRHGRSAQRVASVRRHRAGFRPGAPGGAARRAGRRQDDDAVEARARRARGSARRRGRADSAARQPGQVDRDRPRTVGLSRTSVGRTRRSSRQPARVQARRVVVGRPERNAGCPARCQSCRDQGLPPGAPRTGGHGHLPRTGLHRRPVARS